MMDLPKVSSQAVRFFLIAPHLWEAKLSFAKLPKVPLEHGEIYSKQQLGHVG